MSWIARAAVFRSRGWYVFCLLLALTVFLGDFFTPLGFAHGNLYFAVVMLSALTRNQRFIALVGILCIALTCVGFFISPPGFELVYVLSNRFLSVLEIGGLTLLLELVARQIDQLEDSNQDLRASREMIDEQGRLLDIAGEAASMGGWMIMLPESRVVWSRKVREIHQVPPDFTPDLVSALDFYAPEYRHRLDQIVRRCCEDGEPFDEEAEIITYTGERTWVRLVGRGIRDAAGRIHRIQGAFMDIREEKNYQTLMVTLQHRFRQFADSIPHILWTASADGNMDFINQTGVDYTGRASEDLLNEAWTAQLHPDDISGCVERWTRSLVTGKHYSHQFRLQRHDGQYRWHQAEAQALFNPEGQVMKWCGSAIDVHDFLMLEKEHQRQNLSLVNTLETISDAFFLLDPEWRFAYVNRACEHTLERRREELLGNNVWALFPEAETFRQQYEYAVEHRVPVEFVEYYAPMNKWMSVRAFPSEEGLAVYFHDVTQRHEQEEEMRLARERFENVARATTDAIWDWDLTSQRMWWNDTFESLFGHERSEQTQSADFWSSHIHPDDRSRVLDSVAEAHEGKDQSWSEEYRFARQDGSYALVLDSGFIIRDREGRAIRMVGGMTDITERRLMEARLGQSQRLEAIGQLTGGVAHDFNNLLTVIQGNTELLLESLPEEEQLHSLAEMTAQAADRAAQLIRHLLAFARRQPLEPQTIDIKKLINGMEGLLRRTLMEHISIELVHGGGLWQAMVDAAQLENALLNLCLNARDAMPQGGRLTIETTNTFLDQGYADQHVDIEPGQYVMIAVSDTGEGIPESQLMHVFDPFFTTKDTDKGTGLGLSMVYGFVKQSRGHIKIYSEQKQGTTVRMYLPKATEQAVTVSQPARQVKGGAETILLVEDDEMVRLYAESVLKDLGYNILSAENAAQALSLLDAHPEINLLFTDIIMPGGMNGRQLADEVLQRRPGLKVLFTSGYTENAIVHHGRLDPGVQLISKPYLRRELASKLRNILGTTGKA